MVEVDLKSLKRRDYSKPRGGNPNKRNGRNSERAKSNYRKNK